MKKKELIHLVELMIVKYEIANNLGYLEVGRYTCPLCKYYNNECFNCILPTKFKKYKFNSKYTHFLKCMDMLTTSDISCFINARYGFITNKKIWQLRLKFWQTALLKVKEINYPGFFTDLSKIRNLLHTIDKELYEINNHI